MRYDSSISRNWNMEILETLDFYAKDMNFPTFENNNFPATDMRLTVFRSNNEWLLVFEVIAFANSQNFFVNIIYAYGNKLSEQGMQTAYEIGSVENLNIIEDKKVHLLTNLTLSHLLMIK